MPRTTVWPAIVALAFSALVLWARWFGPYELFHDELYYWAGAQRFELGYVDHPPLAPWILAIATALLGDGSLPFVLLPVIATGAAIVLTGSLARRLGAEAFGQMLASLCTASAPVVLVFSSFYSVNAFEVLLWTWTCFLFVEVIRTGNQYLWLAIGTLTGVGLLNKHTFALLVAGLLAGMIATPMRAELRRQWFWLGITTAALLVLPNLWWNFVNGWPSLAFYRSRDVVGNLPTSILQAVLMQLAAIGPAAILVAIPGVFFLLFSRAARPYRPLGIAFSILFVIMIISGQRRSDRIAGIYPVVFAAGAAYWARGSGAWKNRARWAIAGIVLLVGLAAVPATLPLLPREQVASYFKLLGTKPNIEPADVGQDIPLYLLGRLEWSRFASRIIDAWETLPADERSRSVILAPHWVFTSVIEYYGRHRRLPPVVAPHNAYYFWRNDAVGRDIAVSVGVDESSLTKSFATTRLLDTFRCEHCVSFRPDMPIYVSYGPARPLEELLTTWRHFGLDAATALHR